MTAYNPTYEELKREWTGEAFRERIAKAKKEREEIRKREEGEALFKSAMRREISFGKANKR